MGTPAFDPHFQLGKHKITAQCRFPTVFRNCNCKTGKQRTIVKYFDSVTLKAPYLVFLPLNCFLAL